MEPMTVTSLKKKINFDHYLQKQMSQLQKIRLKQLKEISKVYDMIQENKLKERYEYFMSTHFSIPHLMYSVIIVYY